MKKLISTSLLATGLFFSPYHAALADHGHHSDTFDNFQIRGRIIGVLPDSGGSTTISGDPEASDEVVPELDISYFFTPHIAAELILATSKHDVKLKDSNLGDLDLGSLWILPPTLTLQYHFTPHQTFSLYVGAGVNYTHPYKEDADDVNDLDADGDWGAAVQIGFDYWLDDHIGINFDIKKVWVELDVDVNDNAIKGEVQLDPLIVGVGITYRF